jgi:hypothetical protein
MMMARARAMAAAATTTTLSPTLSAASHHQQRANSTSSSSAAASTATAASDAAHAAAADARAAADAAHAALSPSEREELRVAHYVLGRPARSGLHAGLLTALAATHRDLHVALDALHKRDALGVARPLLDAPPVAATTTTTSGNKQTQSPPPTPTQSFYPVRDLTRLPDAPEPAAGPPSHLRGAYMGKGAGPWQQLLPNHVEVSYALGTAVPLWPAMEASFPMFLDFDAAVRQLRRGSSRGRARAGARRRRPDKPYAVLVNTDARAERAGGGGGGGGKE